MFSFKNGESEHKIGVFFPNDEEVGNLFSREAERKAASTEWFPGALARLFWDASVCVSVHSVCLHAPASTRSASHFFVEKPAICRRILNFAKLHVKPAFAENEKSPFVAAEGFKYKNE